MRKCTLAIAFLVFGCHSISAQETNGSLTFRNIANAGTQIIAPGGESLLIDALWSDDYGGRFIRIEDDTQQALFDGAAPFENVVAILATHEHGDHSDAQIIADYMQTAPRARLISVEPVTRSVADSHDGLANRIHVAGSEPLTVGPFTITTLNIPHVGNQSRNMAHVAFLVEVGAHSVIHLGDAVVDSDLLASEMAAADVVIAPPWWVGHIPVSVTAKVLVAHLTRTVVDNPPEEIPPGHILFGRPGDTFVLSP